MSPIVVGSILLAMVLSFWTGVRYESSSKPVRTIRGSCPSCPPCEAKNGTSTSVTELIAAREWEIERLKARCVEFVGPMEWTCIPENLRKRYLMDGQVLLSEFKAGTDAWNVPWTQAMMQDWMAKTLAGQNMAPGYEHASEDVMTALKWVADNKGAKVSGKRSLVVGSIQPWVEAALLASGSGQVVTVDFNIPAGCDSLAPRQICMHVDTYRALPRTEAQFPFVVTYSSLEHDGLGRYHDPLNPDGDIAAMHELYSMTEPGGYLFVAVPYGEDQLAFWAHRIYGKVRLPKLVEGWEVQGYVWNKVYRPPPFDFSIGAKNGVVQPVIILRRPVNGDLYWSSKKK